MLLWMKPLNFLFSIILQLGNDLTFISDNLLKK